MTNTLSQYNRLGTTYLIVAGIVFGLIFAGFAFMLVRYRAGRDPSRAPGETHKHTGAEIAYVVLLVCVTAFLVTITFRTLTKEDSITVAAAKARNAVRVQVIAAQWTWRFRYGGSPQVTIDPPRRDKPTPLYLPAGRPVLFTGYSQDVLHQFWVPGMRFKRQLWPDHNEVWGMVFPKPGRYLGVCNWFCGLWHDRMRFEVIVMPAARFQSWLAGQRRKAAAA